MQRHHSVILQNFVVHLFLKIVLMYQSYSVAKEDEDKLIKCILVPAHGTMMEVRQIINATRKLQRSKISFYI